MLSVLKRTTRWRILTISRGYKRLTLHTGGLPYSLLRLLAQAIASYCFRDLGGGEFSFRGADGWHSWHRIREKLDPKEGWSNTPPEQIIWREEKIPPFTQLGCHHGRERASQEKRGGSRNESVSQILVWVKFWSFSSKQNRSVLNVSTVSSPDWFSDSLRVPTLLHSTPKPT